MKPYDSSSPHTQFTDTSWVYVNQVSGDDSAAWSENPDSNWENPVRFKTFTQAFKFAASRGTNISIMLEVTPSPENEFYKDISKCEYFHVPLERPLTITGCNIRLACRSSLDNSSSVWAALVFDYVSQPETFINAYSTFVSLGPRVYVGLSKPNESRCDYFKLPIGKRPGVSPPPEEFEEGFQNLIDKYRCTTHSICFHGMGLHASPESRVYVKVDGISQLSTFHTDKVETTVTVKKKKQTKLVLPAKNEILQYGGSILSMPYGITTKKLIELTEKQSTSTRKPMKHWYECTKSSNWHGVNAAWRLMNMLSPNMPDSIFNKYLSWAAGRGVDHVNVFVTNHNDGYNGGLYCNFSIYGPFDNETLAPNYPTINIEYTRKMSERMDKIQEKGLGIVLWMTADDTPWNHTRRVSSHQEIIGLDNPEMFTQLCNDVKRLGWFDRASNVVVGLECDEYWIDEKFPIDDERYWNPIVQNIEILKQVSNLMVGVHFTSVPDRMNAAIDAADIIYAQTQPNQKSLIAGTVNRVVNSFNKPCNMFEMERFEDRNSCNKASKNGAYSVGNW